MESLVLPSADIDPNFEGVVVLTKSGRLITGIRVNEDNFSIQLREQETGRLLSYFKHELADDVSGLAAAFQKHQYQSLAGLWDAIVREDRRWPATAIRHTTSAAPASARQSLILTRVTL
jgi:hypothetical protein